jgi:hypothetical protein
LERRLNDQGRKVIKERHGNGEITQVTHNLNLRDHEVEDFGSKWSTRAQKTNFSQGAVNMLGFGSFGLDADRPLRGGLGIESGRFNHTIPDYMQRVSAQASRKPQALPDEGSLVRKSKPNQINRGNGVFEAGI